MAFLTTSSEDRRWRVARRRGALWLLGLVLLCAGAPRVSAEPPPPAEYQLKAVFLFNFAQFVEWPSNSFHDLKSPLIIGVLGENPFGTYLEELVKGEKVGDRPLVVRGFRKVEEITDCHILFIARSEAGACDKEIAQLKGRSLFTVSDIESFTRKGGMVRFVTEGGKIRLRINVEAANACDLKISSKILRAATIVTTGKE